MEKIHTYQREAHYYETDRMDVVHHSNYIRWFEEARVDFMKKIGLPYDQMEKKGIMLPVLSADCKYRSPVKFGDKVIIRTWVSVYTGVKVQMEYEITDAETGKIRTIGSTSHCFTDTNLKPLRIKKANPNISTIFEQLTTDDNT